MEENLKAICIKTHAILLIDGEREIPLKFDKMELYDYGKMIFPKLGFMLNEFGKIDESDYEGGEVIYRLSHPDYKLKLVNYNEIDFKKCFSTDAIKIQRKEGLMKIAKRGAKYNI